jgi:hypothetical protein
MSKRVEVMSKDTWAVSKYGVLHQIRGTKHRLVASSYVEAFSWVDGLDESWHRVAPVFAKATITGLGGEWAEVAEEKAATTRTKTLHVYEYHNGKKIVMHTNRDDQRPGLYLGTTTITIAGVT